MMRKVGPARSGVAQPRLFFQATRSVGRIRAQKREKDTNRRQGRRGKEGVGGVEKRVSIFVSIAPVRIRTR